MQPETYYNAEAWLIVLACNAGAVLDTLECGTCSLQPAAGGCAGYERLPVHSRLLGML